MIEKIDHIGIAVRRIEAAIPLYRDVLGLGKPEIHEVPEQKVRVAIFPVGEVKIELLDALTPDSPIASFLQKRGEGIHHVAFRVDDIRESLKRLKDAGIRPINKEPSSRGEEYWIAFLHPSSTGRVLIELAEKKTEMGKEVD